MSKNNETIKKKKTEMKDIEGKAFRSLYKFDVLKIYFGEPHKVNDNITLHIPSIGDILEFGEEKMYESITPFVTNSTQYKLMLWESGIDWTKVSDFELFIMFCQKLNSDSTKLIFGGFDFSKLQPFKKVDQNTGEESIVLADPNTEIEVDEKTYYHISEFLRIVFDMHPKTEKAKGKLVKQMIIEKAQSDLAVEALKNKNKGQSSTLLPLISSLLNHPGFKYNKQQLKECNIFEFMDSVKRLQIMQSAFSLMTGMYSGMVDIKGKEEELNWLRDLSN